MYFYYSIGSKVNNLPIYNYSSLFMIIAGQNLLVLVESWCDQAQPHFPSLATACTQKFLLLLAYP